MGEVHLAFGLSRTHDDDAGGGRGHQGADGVEHKAVARAWVTDLARRAGAREPQLLARQLTLLLDGGLAEGVVEADPEAPVIAGAAARLLVDHACAESPRG